MRDAEGFRATPRPGNRLQIRLRQCLLLRHIRTVRPLCRKACCLPCDRLWEVVQTAAIHEAAVRCACTAWVHRSMSAKLLCQGGRGQNASVSDSPRGAPALCHGLYASAKPSSLNVVRTSWTWMESARSCWPRSKLLQEGLSCCGPIPCRPTKSCSTAGPGSLAACLDRHA